MYQVSKDYDLLCELLSLGADIKAINPKGKLFVNSFSNETKEFIVSECKKYDLEWIIPINAEFSNNVGDIEYELAIFSIPSKRGVIYTPHLFKFDDTTKVFIKTDSNNILSFSYVDFDRILCNISQFYVNTIEEAFKEGISILKHAKNEFNG